MNGLQAAILGVKLKHLPKWNEKRRKNASLYNEHLSNLALITPREMADGKPVYHLYVVRIDKKIRKPLIDYLKTQGISTGIHYPIALPNLKAYAYLNHNGHEFPEATKVAQQIVSLPMFPELEESQIKYIAEKTREFGL